LMQLLDCKLSKIQRPMPHNWIDWFL